MAAPILHSDQIPLDEAVGHSLRQGLQAGIITDAQVSAATTNALLRTAVGLYAGHSDTAPIVPVIQRALVVGLADGSMSDANVSAATTVALLVANTYSAPGKVGPIEFP